MKKRYWAAALAVALGSGGCTPGAISAPAGGSISQGAVKIHVSLLNFKPKSSQFGTVAGYSPNVVTIPHGSTVQFVNDDNFTHTASSVGTTGFPSGDPFHGNTLSQSGTDLATANWSSGALPGSSASQTFKATVPGTYYYGCFFHYGTPMRGVIVVQ